MNAKHSLCMSKRLLLILGAVLCAQSLQGQDAWHEGRNVAGLAGAEASEKPSQATLFGKFTSGDFRNWSQGKTLWSAGATASSEIQLKDMVMVGSFGFTQEYGTQMMGSMFTNPGYYLVDVVEFTPGSKSRQTYNLDGGIAWKNGGRWIPGFTAHFQGINYAKRKDLRHTTYRQELEVVPSVLYQGEGWRIGASYIFEKNSEFIQAEQVGPARADSYYALLDKGMRYGAYQAWDGSGIHLAEPGVDRFPVQETAHGGSLQFSLGVETSLVTDHIEESISDSNSASTIRDFDDDLLPLSAINFGNFRQYHPPNSNWMERIGNIHLKDSIECICDKSIFSCKTDTPEIIAFHFQYRKLDTGDMAGNPLLIQFEKIKTMTIACKISCVWIF